MSDEIRRLQQNLIELGFLIVGEVNGVMNLSTEIALREFQSYAKMPNLAREAEGGADTYLSRLSQIANPKKYEGPVHGLADAATQELIALWVGSRLRCPVVISAYNVNKRGVKTLFKENIWRRNEVASLKPRMFARDFSGYYPLGPDIPPPHTEESELVVGEFVNFKARGQIFGGPQSVPTRHTWGVRPGSLNYPLGGTEILPDNLVGRPLGELSTVEASNYRVARAASEVECLGFFDALNAYDNAIMSLGICHWTLGIINGTRIDDGELCGYLSYLEEFDKAAFDTAFGIWGIAPREKWKSGGVPNGQALFDRSQRKYVSWLLQQGPDGTFQPVPKTLERVDFFQSWHWFYRFEMAARTIVGFRRRMWHMARVRVRDILETPWRASARVPDVQEPSGTRRAKLGDVYTSERAVALLLRWHIRFPSHVVSNGQSGAQLEQAYREAGIPSPALPPNMWRNCEERQLIRGIRKQVARIGNKDLIQTMGYVLNWPPWLAKGANSRRYQLSREIGPLLETRRSFTLDETGLPPAPSAVPLTPFGETSEPTEVLAKAAVVSAAPPAPAESKRPVLKALENGEVVYIVESDGRTLTRTYKGTNADPTAEQRRAITRLTFFDANAVSSGPLVSIPVIPGSLSELSVADAGEDDSELKIRGRLRSFISPRSNDDFVEFRAVVNHGPSVIEGRRVLRFGRLAFSGLGDVENIALGDLGREFTAEESGQFAPTLPRRIGINSTDVVSTYRFRRKLSFIPHLPGTATPPGSQAKLQLLLSLELPLKRDPQRVAPFGLDFSPRDMLERSATQGPPSPVPYIDMFQRQPRGERWNKDDAAGVHWLVDALVPQKAALTTWNRLVAQPVLDSLGVIANGRPITFLPTLEDDEPGRTFWLAQLTVVDRLPRSDVEIADIVLGHRASVFESGHVTVVGRTLGPPPEAGMPTAEPVKPKLLVRGRLEGVRTLNVGGPAVVARFEVTEESKTEAEADDESGVRAGIKGFAFSARQVQPPVAAGGSTDASQVTRMGALELRLLPAARSAGDDLDIPGLPSRDLLNESSFRAGFQETVVPEANYPGRVTERQVKYALGVSSVEPGGQDDVPGEEFAADLGTSIDNEEEYTRHFRRDPPLVFAPDTASAPSPDRAKFFVSAQETITGHDSQTITLRLRRSEQPSARPLSSVIVIDPHPMLVTKVEISDFGASLDAALTDELGNWTNRADVGAGWELSAGASGLDLVLPPQGVGEAMHRRTGEPDLVPADASGTGFKPLDFRFTPPARVRLQPSFFRQRFAEAPWNLRRILGYRGQRTPGAGVDEVDFELLYGMRGRVSYPFLRLAEVGSRLGHLPGQQPPRTPWLASEAQGTHYRAAREVWAALYSSLLSRLAVLEFWDPNRLGKLVISDEDGLQYELRENAELRYPIIGATPDPGTPPHRADGLPGSYSWGFESKNIYQAVRRNPRSTAAQLSAPFFSSLGGWGHQKASFDRGLTTIYSDITMGRAGSINIERIGRISVFWNRAKHVIVYERTAVPSRQFFLEQEPLLGNCVLRKVDEYVELLQDERRYPEGPSPAASRGYLLGCRFEQGKPPRIRVNSRWGEDVGKTGWKIPLWVRGAAPADVYPKPAISLLLAGEQPDEHVCGAMDDPERLYFYTSTDERLGNDTDKWPPVFGVDWGFTPTNNLRAPRQRIVDGLDGDEADEGGLRVTVPESGDPNQFGNTPEDPVAIGSGDFTFALMPLPKPVNVVAERAPQAVSAFMHNVTAMRGAAEATLDSGAMSFVSFRDILANVLASALAQLNDDDTPLPPALFTHILDDAQAGLDRFRSTFNNVFRLFGADTGFEAGAREEVLNRLETLLTVNSAQIGQEIESILLRAREEYRGEFVPLRAQFPTFADARSRLLSRLDLLIEGSEEAEGVRERIRRVRGWAGETLQTLARSRERSEEVVRLARERIAGAQCDICALPDWRTLPPPEATRIVGETRTQLDEVLSQVDFLVADITRHWLGGRLDAGRNALREERRGIERDARQLFFDLRKTNGPSRADVLRILGELSNAAQTLYLTLDKLISGDPAVPADSGWEGALRALGVTRLEQPALDLRQVLEERIAAVTGWDDFEREYESATNVFFGRLQQLTEQAIALVKQERLELTAQANLVLDRFLPRLESLKSLLDGAFSAERLAELRADLAERSLTHRDLRRELERLLAGMTEVAAEFAARVKKVVTFPPVPVAAPLGDALRLLRSFGKTPRLPSLDFSLPTSGYYFFDFPNGKDLPRVDLTPLLAKANQLLGEAARGLNPIEIKLPTTQLAERFIPFNLEQFQWPKLLPNCGGLKLDGLFPNLRAPLVANDRVKVTHGFNPETRSGWMQIEMDVPFGDQPTTIFSLAGVTLRLLRARFQAVARIETVAGQVPRQTVRGTISGDWDLQVGSFPVALLANCALTFDEGGRIRFDISPDRVRLQQVLAFLADLLAKFGYSEKGFSVAITPAGVRSILDLPLPDVQSGTFGLANLNLGFSFGLSILGGFKITTGLNVGRRTAPFTITVFILGGAGWFELEVSYTPAERLFETRVSIGILAAASLAISLGPIKGGIYAYFGITVEYRGSNQSPGNLTVGLLLLFIGEVSLLGIINVSLSLSLEAQYTNGGGLIGRGQVSYKIKIGPFFTIKVNAGVQYQFGRRGGSGRDALAPGGLLEDAAQATALPSDQRDFNPADYATTARQYLQMFA